MAAAMAILPALTTVAGAGAGTMTAVSAITGIASGLAQYQAGRQEAAQLDYQARLAELRGRQEAIRVNDALLKTIAQNNVAAAASGLQGTGSVAEAQRQSEAKAAEELNINLFNTGAESSALRKKAKNARTAGLNQAAMTGAGVLSDAYNRVTEIKSTK